MRPVYAVISILLIVFATSNAMAISPVEVFEKIVRLDSLFGEQRVSRAELSRAYGEAKAAEDSYALTHKDKLMGQFALCMAQFGAAKAVLEAGVNDPAPLNAARETMKKIRAMIRKK